MTSSLYQVPLRILETKMYLLRRGIQTCMVVVFIVVVCGSSKRKHHQLSHHKHYTMTNSRAIKSHDQGTVKRTAIVSQTVRWKDESDPTLMSHAMLSVPTKAAPILSYLQNKPLRKVANDRYINLPKIKKDVIFNEFDNPLEENGKRGIFLDSTDSPVDSGVGDEDVYKKASMINQQDMKKVEDADKAVSDVIDLIIDDDKSFTGGRDSRKSSTTTTSGSTTESISEDVEVAIDEGTEGNKNIGKDGAQNDAHDDQQQQQQQQQQHREEHQQYQHHHHHHQQQQQQQEQRKQLITPTPMQTTPKQDDKVSKDRANQSWTVTLDTDKGIHSNAHATQKGDDSNNANPTEEPETKNISVVYSYMNDDSPAPTLLTADIVNITENLATTKPGLQDAVDHTSSQLLIKEDHGGITDIGKAANETVILEKGKINHTNTDYSGVQSVDKESSGDGGDISSMTNEVHVNMQNVHNNSASVTSNDYDYADMEKHGSDGEFRDEEDHQSLNQNLPASNFSSTENNAVGDIDSIGELSVNNSKGFISSGSSSVSSDDADSNRTSDEPATSNRTSPARFIHEHPVAFKILMEYFQNETSLQDKLRNKLRALPNAKGTENAMRKSLGSIYGLHSREKSSLVRSKQPLSLRELIKSLLQLAKKTEEAKNVKEFQSRNSKESIKMPGFLGSKRKTMAFASKQPLFKKVVSVKFKNKHFYAATNAPKQVKASRKTDVALADRDSVKSASKIHVTPITKEDVSNYVTQPSIDPAAMANTLGIMEDTINRLLTQNENLEVAPATPSVSTGSAQVQQPNNAQSKGAIHVLDANTILYKKRLKSLEISLSQDIFSSWMYHFRSLEEMSIKPEQLRSGIASLGSIDRLARVVKKAIKGETVNVLIVGGSISAGGGLERDRHDVHGRYFRAFEEWWKKTVTPITASNLLLDVVAIGGTDSEYFSYCIKNYIKNPPDLVLWELAANDYRRYTGRNMDPAKPLEQLTRVLLTLPSHPAIIYVNFFRGDYYKTTQGQDCPDSEDEGGRLISEYYKITSLSWRNVICSEIRHQVPNFALKREYSPMTVNTLFSSDGYHPSLLGHAQCATLLISYIRSVFEEVVSREVARVDKNAPSNDPNSSENDVLPRPIYDDPANPTPMCWTLLTSDYHTHIENQLPNLRIIEANGYEFANITRWPVRTDRLRCLKADFPGATLKIKFYAPPPENDGSRVSREIVLISHNSFSGSATLWLDNNDAEQVLIVEPEGQRRTQVNLVSRDLVPGDHVINIRALNPGFCVSGLAIL